MNGATTILRNEHDEILKMLDATEVVARRLAHNEPVSPDTLGGLLEFFRLFADLCHHMKEEDVLFPALEKKGLLSSGELINGLLVEHDQGRSVVKQMVAMADAYSDGIAAGGHRWARASLAFVEMMRRHIKEENDLLLVQAEALFSGAEQEALAAEFGRVEKERMGIGTHERLRALKEILTTEIMSDPHPEA
ncbi:MAG: hemerythrin domain-containing protein [Acidobacteria bacterium]|nr:hemerythrin domain-containing protein [Acidobacteriota bacterium]